MDNYNFSPQVKSKYCHRVGGCLTSHLKGIDLLITKQEVILLRDASLTCAEAFPEVVDVS